jgi:hypothetical protein
MVFFLETGGWVTEFEEIHMPKDNSLNVKTQYGMDIRL